VIALIDTAIFFLVMNWVFKFDSKLLIMALISFIGGAAIITLKDELGNMVEKRRALNDVNDVNDEDEEDEEDEEDAFSSSSAS
jgi:hypothetical protein